MRIDTFFAELKRRNVYKVAVAYIVAGWALSQGIAQVFPVFDIPNWAIRLIVLLIILGLPIAMILAWMFELTPEGVKRTETADAMPGITRRKKHAWIYIVVIGALFSIGLFFLGGYMARNSHASSNELGAKSIAVLPFDNLSRDPDNAYFTEGMQDEILTRLAKVADLKVISRTSTQHFKSTPENLPQIAKQLGVTNILEGSVQKAKDQVRVNVQLINALTDAHLWAETYDRKLTDIFSVETDIAKTIADTLQARLTGSEQTAMSNKPTENSEAYELYLKGRFFWNKRTGQDLKTACDYFQQAIAQLQRTLTLDDKFGYALWNLGEALYLKGDTAAAIAKYEEAQSLDDDPQIVGLLGRAYADAGQKDKAMELIGELEARTKQQFVRGYLIALIYIGLGDKTKAIDYLEREYLNHDNIDTAWIRGDPMLDPLRGDPRFEALAEKILPAQEFGKSDTQR